MAGKPEDEYHRARAARELALAAHCADSGIARLHLDLAQLHLSRTAITEAEAAPSSPPTLVSPVGTETK